MRHDFGRCPSPPTRKRQKHDLARPAGWTTTLMVGRNAASAADETAHPFSDLPLLFGAGMIGPAGKQGAGIGSGDKEREMSDKEVMPPV